MNRIRRYIEAVRHELRYNALGYILPHFALLTAGLVAWSFWPEITAVLQ